MKSGKLFRFFREKIQKIPLRHQRDKFAVCRHVREVANDDVGTFDASPEFTHLIVRQRKKFLQQSELKENVERGGMDRIAAKVPQEVGVLFDDDDFDAGTRQEKSEHHASRPSTHDAA